MSSPSQGFNVFFDIIQLIQDEGVDLPFEPTINFIGAGVLAVDDPGNNRINITIPGFLAHPLLDGTQNNDTVAQSPTRGSLIYGNATPFWDELLKGANGTFLKSNTTDIFWSGIVKADISDFAHNLLSASHGDTVVGTPVLGDLIKGNAGTWQRFLKGTALQQIRVNAGGTDLEYFTPTAFPTLFNQTIQDEGIALTQRPTFNFIGAGVTAVDNAGSSRTDITIPGGSAGWTLVGTLDLGADGDTMTVTITTAKRFLYVIFCAEAIGGTVSTQCRFNNNSGANYSYYRQQDAGAWATTVSDTELEMDPGAFGHREMIILEINDEPSHAKHFFSREVHSDDALASSVQHRQQLDGIYAVDSARITSLVFINTGAGSYQAGLSFIRVWGSD